jgi:hypothetical protein
VCHPGAAVAAPAGAPGTIVHGMRRPLALALVALLAAPIALAAADPRPVTRGDLRAALLASPKVPAAAKRFIREGDGTITPARVARAIREGARLGDLTGDGLRDFAVPFGYGGSGGDDQVYVVSAHSGTVRVIFARRGWLGVRVRVLRRAKLLEITRPIYRPGDPNCCASAARVSAYRIAPSGEATLVSTRVDERE